MTEYVRMIMFGGFLLTAAAEDMRHRKVSRRLLLIAAVCGIPWGLRGAFCGGAASFAAGFLPGAMLLLLSRLLSLPAVCLRRLRSMDPGPGFQKPY